MQKVPALVGKSCFSSMLQVAVQGLHVYNTSVGKLQHYNTTDSTLQTTNYNTTESTLQQVLQTARANCGPCNDL